MIERPFHFVLLLTLFAPLPKAAFAQSLPPELTRPVNDFAHVIDEESKAEMERRIRALNAATSDVAVVATIETVAPYGDIREYAVKMFENRGRGIGDKGKDNGLLVLLTVKDRKVWIEVGYDLEQFITDGFAGETSRDYMAPAFARGEYGPGLLAGVSRLIGRVAQGRGVSINGLPPPEPEGGGSSSEVSPGLIILILILIILMSNVGRRARIGRGARRWGGGPWSGWNSGIGPFGGGGGFGGGGFGGGFGGFGGGRSGGGGGGAGW